MSAVAITRLALTTAALGTSALALRSGWLLFDQPLTEDGYLALTIARHIGTGLGPTADGTELTNGFQPLWVAICSLWFFVFSGDREAAVRAVLITHAAIFVTAAHVWGRVLAAWADGHRDVCYAAATLTFLFAFPLLVQGFNGLETGLLILGLGLAARSMTRNLDRSPWDALRPGVILGLLVLVRVDAAFLAAASVVTVMMLGSGRFTTRLARATALGVPALLLPLPWFAWGWLQFGSLMPISGQSLAPEAVFDARLAVHNMAGALARNLLPVYWGGYSQALVAPALLGLAFLARRGPVRLRWTWPAGQSDRALPLAIISLVSYVALLSVAYPVTSRAMYFWPRYMVPAALIGVALIAMATVSVWTRSPARAVLLWGVLCLPSLVCLPAWHGSALAGTVYSAAVSYPNPPLFGQVDLARQFAGPGDTVGGLQSGTLGFFIDGAHNLDGKVSPSALRARREGTLAQFMADHAITIFVDFQIHTMPGRSNYLDRDTFFQRYAQVYPDSQAPEYGWAVYRLREAERAGAER